MFRGILIFVLVLVAHAANAQSVSHHASSDQTATHNQADPKADTQPSQFIAIQNEIERLARAIETANSEQQSPEEKQSAKRNLAAQEKIAAWAPAVFYVALAELILTAIGLLLLWKTITETRRIGQAQVRAYISIKSAAVNFIEFIPNENDSPQVAITVKNFGQSPARKFFWNPTLQYMMGDQRRERRLADGFRAQIGTDIQAQEEIPDAALIGEMQMNKFAALVPPITSPFMWGFPGRTVGAFAP